MKRLPHEGRIHARGRRTASVRRSSARVGKAPADHQKSGGSGPSNPDGESSRWRRRRCRAEVSPKSGRGARKQCDRHGRRDRRYVDGQAQLAPVELRRGGGRRLRRRAGEPPPAGPGALRLGLAAALRIRRGLRAPAAAALVGAGVSRSGGRPGSGARGDARNERFEQNRARRRDQTGEEAHDEREPARGPRGCAEHEKKQCVT